VFFTGCDVARLLSLTILSTYYILYITFRAANNIISTNFKILRFEEREKAIPNCFLN